MKNKNSRKRAIKLGVFLIFAFTLTYLVALQAAGNFHAAIPGELYRSAQLSSGDIYNYKQKYGIKTILNLRGENTGSKWYDEEVAEAKAAGVTHLDYRMSSKRMLNKENAFELIAIMRDAPKPLLIHCRGGSDRTGLAAAMYVAGVKKGTEEDAELQLSLLYGHIPLWFIGSYAMNRTFEAMEPFFGYTDS